MANATSGPLTATVVAKTEAVRPSTLNQMSFRERAKRLERGWFDKPAVVVGFCGVVEKLQFLPSAGDPGFGGVAVKFYGVLSTSIFLGPFEGVDVVPHNGTFKFTPIPNGGTEIEEVAYCVTDTPTSVPHRIK